MRNLGKYYNKAGTNGRTWQDSAARKDNENSSGPRQWLSSHGNNVAFIKLKNICSCPWQIFLISPHKGWKLQNCFFFPGALGRARTQELFSAFFGFMLTLVRRAGASEMRPQRWPNKTQWIIGSETPLLSFCKLRTSAAYIFCVTSRKHFPDSAPWIILHLFCFLCVFCFPVASTNLGYDLFSSELSKNKTKIERKSALPLSSIVCCEKQCTLGKQCWYFYCQLLFI